MIYKIYTNESWFKSMKIMRLCYGMANTMFQYAAYLQLKKMYPDEKIYVDTMWFDATGYPYDLKKAFGLDVSTYDFYEIAKKEERLDYEKEFQKFRRWNEFGYDTWIQMMNAEKTIQSQTCERELPELYLKAGYQFDIILTHGFSMSEAYQILSGELKVDDSRRQKLKRMLYRLFGEYNPIFIYERAIRLPYRRNKLLSDLKNKRKPDFSGSLPVSRLKYEGEAYYCTFGNENDVFGIEDELKEVFSFVPFSEENNIVLAESIEKTKSVAVHVRASAIEYGMSAALKRNYYRKAVRYIEKKIGSDITYYIFSDRPTWVMDHLEVLGMDSGKKFVVVNNNNGEKSFRDMQLMSLCKHVICAQSTFSWWAGVLNKNPKKIIITPYETFPGTISF